MTDPSASTEGAAPVDAPASIDHEARVAAFERRIVELEANHAARLIRAELRAEAIRHGMVDLDGLKLVDPKGISVTDDGEVRGASTIMRELKRSKPWLFGLAAASSSTSAAPPAQQPIQKAARTMSHAEWRAARAELLKRR